MTKHNTNKRNLNALAQMREVKEATGCGFSCVVCQQLRNFPRGECRAVASGRVAMQ